MGRALGVKHVVGTTNARVFLEAFQWEILIKNEKRNYFLVTSMNVRGRRSGPVRFVGGKTGIESQRVEIRVILESK